MKEYEFTLKFALPDVSEDPARYLDELFEAGCDDAVIGVGKKGRIAFTFNREARSALKAFQSALENVRSVLPDARLIEANPDMVGVSDIADLFHCSRQNIGKLIAAHSPSFPVPIHEGRQSLWHLSQVLDWFQTAQRKSVDPRLVESARAAMQTNIAKESAALDQRYRTCIEPLAADAGRASRAG